MITAIYAGTFDPITNGHLDIIKRSLSFCDRLAVAIGNNPLKKTHFPVSNRMDMIRESIKIFDMKDQNRIKIDSFDGLLVDYAKEVDGTILIRGIRNVSDFEYEITLAQTNKAIDGIETVFLPTSPELMVVSSSMVKEIARHGKDVSKFVPDNVNKVLKSIFAKD